MLKFKRVVFNPKVPKEYADQYPFEKDQVYLLLGEIENMEGHCVVVENSGKVFWGYHTENFDELKEND